MSHTSSNNSTPKTLRRDSHPALDRVSQDDTYYPPPTGPQDINSHCWRLASCVLLVRNSVQGTEYLTVQTNKKPAENNFPGGKVENGETYPDAAVRELKEETNLIAQSDDLILLHEGSDGRELLDPPKPPYWVKTYLCLRWEGLESPGPEEYSVSWRPLSELTDHPNPVWKDYHTRIFHKYQEYLQNHHLIKV